MTKQRLFINLVVALTCLPLLMACGGAVDSTSEDEATAPSVEVNTSPFDPDNEKNALDYTALEEQLGPMPEVSRPYRMGVIVKFLGNQYWQILAEGMQDQADSYGIALDIQGAASESDREGQITAMETMVEKGYDAILISPQTDENLTEVVEQARAADILVLNVNDAVLRDADHWVGPNQYQNGVSAAEYVLTQYPEGGKVAVIEGQAGVYAAVQRTKGFKDTLADSEIEVIASVSGDWDLQKSLEAATEILAEHPDLKAFYCNNDIMALGAVEAVNQAGKLGEITVIGTDGIEPAYASIRAGEMTATIDSFPYTTGQVAVEVAVRLLEGQDIPRAVYSPQNIITLENIDNRMEE